MSRRKTFNQDHLGSATFKGPTPSQSLLVLVTVDTLKPLCCRPHSLIVPVSQTCNPMLEMTSQTQKSTASATICALWLFLCPLLHETEGFAPMAAQNKNSAATASLHLLQSRRGNPCHRSQKGSSPARVAMATTTIHGLDDESRREPFLAPILNHVCDQLRHSAKGLCPPPQRDSPEFSSSSLHGGCACRLPAQDRTRAS